MLFFQKLWMLDYMMILLSKPSHCIDVYLCTTIQHFVSETAISQEKLGLFEDIVAGILLTMQLEWLTKINSYGVL